MATIFQSRPRDLPESSPPPIQVRTVSSALAALDVAARQVIEATSAQPEERQRAADLLAFHARRMERLQEAATR